MSARFLLAVSRPGLWFQTVWLYLLPHPDLTTPTAWLGLLYVTWPLNLLVYGWNDIVDRRIDAENPRKDSWLFGARGSEAELNALPPWIIGAQVPFFGVFAWLAGPAVLLPLAGVVVANAAYNAPQRGLRGRPPWDLVNPLAYLVVVWLGVILNGTPALSVAAWVYLVLFCLHAQLMGEIMDYHADRATGRQTSCTRLGMIPSKLLVAALVGVESVLLGLVFGDWVLGGLLLGGVAWLLFDIWYWRDRQYSRGEMTLAGVGMNALGLLSMAWVWWARTLQ